MKIYTIKDNEIKEHNALRLENGKFELDDGSFIKYSSIYFNTYEEDRPDYVKNLIDEINIFCEIKLV